MKNTTLSLAIVITLSGCTGSFEAARPQGLTKNPSVSSTVAPSVDPSAGGVSTSVPIVPPNVQSPVVPLTSVAPIVSGPAAPSSPSLSVMPVVAPVVSCQANYILQNGICVVHYALPVQNQIAAWDNANFTIPPKSWMIGINESFSLQMSSLAMSTIPTLPTNNSYRGLALEQKWVLDMASNHHVGLYRDVIPMSMIAGLSDGDQTYWPDLIKTIDMFRGYNSHLILAMSMPIPQWMIPIGGLRGWCPATNLASDWPTLKNKLSFAIGNFLAVLAKDPNRLNWMQSNLLIEPFNEVDAPNCLTPTQAADIEGGVAFVLAYYGVKLQMLSPSMVENNPQYMQQYYQAGGGGLPNVHFYFPQNSTPATALTLLQNSLSAFQAILPDNLKGRIFLSETGVALSAADDQATTSLLLDEVARNALYTSIVIDSKIKAMTEAVLFWRIFDLPQTPGQYSFPAISGPETHFGIVGADGSTYNSAAGAIFSGIQSL